MRKAAGKHPQPAKKVRARASDELRTLELGELSNLPRKKARMVRVRGHTPSTREKPLGRGRIGPLLGMRRRRAMKHWMAEEKTTPPKESAIAKMYHLTGARLAAAVMPSSTIVRLATRRGTRRTVGALVPSWVVMLTRVMRSTGQVRIHPA